MNQPPINDPDPAPERTGPRQRVQGSQVPDAPTGRGSSEPVSRRGFFRRLMLEGMGKVEEAGRAVAERVNWQRIEALTREASEQSASAGPSDPSPPAPAGAIEPGPADTRSRTVGRRLRLDE